MELFFYAALLGVDIIVFAILACMYNYKSMAPVKTNAVVPSDAADEMGGATGSGQEMADIARPSTSAGP